MKRLALATSLALSMASCTLLGGGDIPCDEDSNCPDRQVCSKDNICVNPVAGKDSGVVDVDAAHSTDGSTAPDARSTSDAAIGVDRPDAGNSSGADATADTDAAGRDSAAGVDAGSGGLCESPPCVIMPDSPTIFCREAETDGPDICPTAGGTRYGQDGNYEGPFSTYSDFGDGRVADALTGLVWMNMPTGNKQLNWSAAVSACEALSTGGQSDWRLPTVAEMTTLLDYGTGAQESMLDANYFPAPSFYSAWTSDGYNGYYWIVSLQTGMVDIKLASQGYGDGYEVRCVRGNASWIGDLRFTQGTYLDRRTGLQWEAQTSAGQNLNQGLARCEGLDHAGHDDWRLPSIKELETLVDRTDSHDSTPHSWPGIVNNTEGSEYWSSTPVTPDLYGWWTLSFGNAKRLSNRYGSSSKYVRCVRGPGG